MGKHMKSYSRLWAWMNQCALYFKPPWWALRFKAQGQVGKHYQTKKLTFFAFGGSWILGTWAQGPQEPRSLSPGMLPFNGECHVCSPVGMPQEWGPPTDARTSLFGRAFKKEVLGTSWAPSLAALGITFGRPWPLPGQLFDNFGLICRRFL